MTQTMDTSSADLSASTDKATPDKAVRSRGLVVWWLFANVAMVAAMIVIGGITRLTESGLSMVEWRPLIGWIPPLTETEWNRVFGLYQLSPEYQIVNSWMDLSAFKTIFFWEYFHRVWGRLIGIVYAVPLVLFLVTGRVERRWIVRLLVLLALGGLQGAIGWWMVTSGLADEPRVSPYRLATHLSMAFIILGLLLWTALEIRATGRPQPAASPRWARVGAGHVLAFIVVTIVLGALVAGNDAGLDYNTFPLMDGQLIPPGYWDFGAAGLLENIATVQFNHRWIAILTLVLTVGFVLKARNLVPEHVRLPLILVGGMVVVQALIGIATLLAVVPIWLAALHQAGAVILFALAIWTRFAVRL